MKKMLFLIGISLLSLQGMAQETTGSSPNKDTWIDQPDVVIKGEDLKNFPGSSLTELLLGRLPGLSQQQTAPLYNELVFVVDGLVWNNVNAINIYNIEDISYYRGGLASKFGVKNSGRSIVLIRTKTAGFNQAFSATANVLAGVTFPKEGSDNKRMYPQSYNVILAEGSDKISWRGSATYRNSYIYAEKIDRDEQFQLNGNVRYRPLKWLDLGASVNYAPANFENSEWGGRANNLYRSENKIDIDHWNGFFTAAIRPVKGLLNEFNVLKQSLRNENELQGTNDMPGMPRVISNEAGNLKINNFSVMNNLNYSFGIHQDRVKFKVAGIYQFERIDQKGMQSAIYYQETNGVPSTTLSTSETRTGGKSGLHSLIGDLSVNLYDILFLQAGVRRDGFSVNESLLENKKKGMYAPYYAAKLNLKNALVKDIDGISQLQLFAAFGQYRTPVEISTGSENYIGFVLNRDRDKLSMQNYGINTAFFNNRLRVSGDWFRSNNYSYLRISLPTGGDGLAGVNLETESKTEGWRLWSSADIFRNTPFRWTTGLSIYKNRVKRSSLRESFFQLNDDGKNNQPLQMGMQHQFAYGNFSLDVNGYAYFKQPETFLEYGSVLKLNTRKATYLNLNFLSLGYDFKSVMSNKTFKGFRVNVIGRNIVQHQKESMLGKMPRTVALALSTTL
ncbi:hypothetical protein DBR43_22890 [Pedobacter sp. KBW06]|uniref:TonB-dependent receptor n=1 Tax=Pedobacter sp. KBW06 TaxID=2153359 RepID=UPI000F591A37|nr:TonB-dependent receptor [Pedobacter sp. KBW06]RQO67387.1 hypothetical protein DBR43_22890 [Pedobacter sp. KBW06]